MTTKSWAASPILEVFRDSWLAEGSARTWWFFPDHEEFVVSTRCKHLTAAGPANSVDTAQMIIPENPIEILHNSKVLSSTYIWQRTFGTFGSISAFSDSTGSKFHIVTLPESFPWPPYKELFYSRENILQPFCLYRGEFWQFWMDVDGKYRPVLVVHECRLK